MTGQIGDQMAKHHHALFCWPRAVSGEVAYGVLAVGQVIRKAHQDTNTSRKACCNLTIQFAGVVLLVDVCMGRALLSLGFGINPKQRTQLHHMFVVGLHCQAAIR